MKKIVIAALVICLGLTAQAQISNYLAPGKSGFGIQVVGEQGPKFQGFGGSIGASYKGKIDISLFGTSDVLGKEANGLTTDKATGTYFEAKATWWLFKNQITKGIDVSFGLMAGVDGSTYKDFISIDANTGNASQYNSFFGGMAGIHGALSLQLSEKWILQPSYVAYYDFGKDSYTETGVESSNSYNGVISNISISLIRRIGEGNAFVVTANNFSQSYNSGSFYNLTAGYIFAF
jgi:hypothetical protein